jgi:hypothetical protein
MEQHEVKPLPPVPETPQVPSPPYRPGPVKAGYEYKQQGVDAGWILSRTANDDRVMLPASSLETWEQAVAARDQAFAQGGESAKYWVDTKRPALPSDCGQVEWTLADLAGENNGTPVSLFLPPEGSHDPFDPNDIVQGCIGDCWLMAGASLVAAMDLWLVDRWLGRYDEHRGIYEFVFYDETDFSVRRVVVDRYLPLLKLAPLKPGYRRGDGLPGDYRYALCKSGTPGEQPRAHPPGPGTA